MQITSLNADRVQENPAGLGRRASVERPGLLSTSQASMILMPLCFGFIRRRFLALGQTYVAVREFLLPLWRSIEINLNDFPFLLSNSLCSPCEGSQLFDAPFFADLLAALTVLIATPRR